MSELLYWMAKAKNSEYELHCLMEDYLNSKNEIIKPILLEKINNLIQIQLKAKEGAEE